MFESDLRHSEPSTQRGPRSIPCRFAQVPPVDAARPTVEFQATSLHTDVSQSLRQASETSQNNRTACSKAIPEQCCQRSEPILHGGVTEGRQKHRIPQGEIR